MRDVRLRTEDERTEDERIDDERIEDERARGNERQAFLRMSLYVSPPPGAYAVAIKIKQAHMRHEVTFASSRCTLCALAVAR